MYISERAYQAPNDSFFIFGPRGTGKSTWIKKNMSSAYVIDLLDGEQYRKYLSEPDKIVLQHLGILYWTR